MSLRRSYVIDKSKKSRHTNDYYPTSPLAVECLLDRYPVPQVVWEPAAGRGWISRTLERSGREVISTDLYEYESTLVPVEFGIDYLKEEPRARCVVTNPPYRSNMAHKFAEKAVRESDFAAMFLRLTFMEGSTRFSFFEEHPPNVLVFSRRMNCEEEKFDTYDGQMGGMVAYAWFVWGKDVEPGRISWVDPKRLIDSRRSTLEQFTTEGK